MRKILFILVIIITSVGAGYFVANFSSKQDQWQGSEFKIQTQIENSPSLQTESLIQSNQTETSQIENENTSVAVDLKKTKLDVPFVVQAPFGNWRDPIFQDACEEASIVMVMSWINNVKTISSQDAQSKILDIVNFENKTFGYNADTDVFDVQKIFLNHFGLQNVTVKENITLEDLINEVEKGNAILVPAFGQVLANPNYTPPGPTAHMLVIIGYDPLAKKFITNDPGTKRGAAYQYDQNILFDSIWDYPSGRGEPAKPIKGQMKKAMIVVSKS